MVMLKARGLNIDKSSFFGFAPKCYMKNYEEQPYAKVAIISFLFNF